jgi:mitochondrial fission protein ELM1
MLGDYDDVVGAAEAVVALEDRTSLALAAEAAASGYRVLTWLMTPTTPSTLSTVSAA